MSDTIPEFDFESAVVTESVPVADSDDLRCVTCGTSITYGGRGPKPKYCADHKKQKSTGTRRAKTVKGTDYRKGVEGLLQVPAMALTMVAVQSQKAEYLADAYTISKAAPAIAEAVSDLANDQPQIAAVLDKVLKVGPYGALMTALMPLAMQLMTNHKVIPVGVGGTVSVEAQLHAAQAEAEAAANAY